MRSGVTPAEALEIVLEAAPVMGPETVATREALGRVLTEPIDSSRDLPPADNSAMDGFAVRAADLAGASSDRPVALRVIAEIAAGQHEARPIGAGEAARILTGAPIPPGADSVVRQEECARDGERVRIGVAPGLGDHVRRAGEDVRAGDRVLEVGTRIAAGQLGMLASLGRSVVSVHQRPRVALLSGGDELVEPDREVSGGRLVSSNSYSLAAQCRELGAEPVYLGIARDRPEDIERHLRAGLGCEVLVSSAGVSVGDRDYVRTVLEKLGCQLVFWGVKMKPGYPLVFGRFEDGRGPLVFGLPGNPVSAMVTFEQFVRPALRKMTGHRRLHRPLVRARLATPLEKPPGRLHFVRVSLERDRDSVIARSTGNQSSGALHSMSLASGLLIFPAEATALRSGELADVQVLDDDFLASDAPGF